MPLLTLPQQIKILEKLKCLKSFNQVDLLVKN